MANQAYGIGSGTYRRIDVKVYGTPVVEEFKANNAITPGQLLELGSTAGDVQRHSSAGGNALPVMVALNDYMQGKEIGTAYADNDMVQVLIPQRGDMLYMLIADGQNIAIGDPLESDGNGDLQKHTADSANTVESPNAIVAVAEGALNLSSSSGADAATRRLLVRIV
jgi:hypothetical protein